MRVFESRGVFLCVLTLARWPWPEQNSMGIRDVSHVTFVAPVRVGTVVLPAGDYVVRHTWKDRARHGVPARA